jgi:hypothetical protein
MIGDPNTLDRVARRLVQASEKDLRHFLGLKRLDPELVANLYLQVRNVVDRWDEEGAVDELALAIYLTATTWESNVTAPVNLLTSLHLAIETTLHAERREQTLIRPSEVSQLRKETQ